MQSIWWSSSDWGEGAKQHLERLNKSTVEDDRNFLLSLVKILSSSYLDCWSSQARCQIFLIVFWSTWNVSETDFITPNIHFNSTWWPGTTIKRRAWTMSLLWCEVKFGFLIPSWKGATVVSSSEAGMVTSYFLLRTEGPSLFVTQNLKMSIATLSPRFDVIHQWLCFIELYKNVMTFW